MVAGRGERFRYDRFELTADGLLSCHYQLDDRAFTEHVSFGPLTPSPAVHAAARLVFLLAGVSYYKTAAPPVVDLGDHAVTPQEREFLRSYYLEGLGEFAYKNGLDLTALHIEGPERVADPVPVGLTDRPLVPFGGGIDSVVVAEATRARHPDTALFVASRAGDRFAAIEESAAVTGLPIRRADRELDPQVLRSRQLGFLNGHVPVTGIVSAMALMAAVIDGRDAVVMSNEWSASSGTVEVDDRVVNHQWSKSLDFEAAFRGVLEESFDGVAWFSALRPYSELWVAKRFAALPAFHPVFRSCNRAFQLDPALRAQQWCGECDKCCFIDLILSPFMSRADLESVFAGKEPLAQPRLEPQFRSLLGDDALTKPFECVGDAGECRAATLLAAERPDRQGTDLLQRLADSIRSDGRPVPTPESLLRPLGPHFIPPRHAEPDLLV